MAEFDVAALEAAKRMVSTGANGGLANRQLLAAVSNFDPRGDPMLDRRTLLGGSAAILVSSPARTQQTYKFAIGYLGFALDRRQHWLAAFRNGLAAEGYVEGRDVAIEFRSADQGGGRLSELADDLVRQNVALIVTTGVPAVLAVKRATQSIPIIFAVPADPARMGLVASFNRPGANITGVYFQITELVAKRLGQLHEVLPGAKRMAILINPANSATAEPTMQQIDSTSGTLGLETQVFNASTSTEIDAAFAALSRWRADALLVGPDPFFNTERERLVDLAARYAVPASYHLREFVEAGGLISYGPDLADSMYQCGIYAGRILKGDKPANMAVVQPTKFEMLINLKTAKALGLSIAPFVLAQADEIIE